MYLSGRGREVRVVDSYVRRNRCNAIDRPPLCPIPDLTNRVKAWHEVAGLEIEAQIGDVTDYDFLLGVFRDFGPDAVVHYAEQPSAPYSMKGYQEARETLENNLLSTLNVTHAVRETNPAIHIVKLGTMGEYGTPNIDIEEGFIDIEHKGRKDRLLFPRQAGSLYHTTKVQDTDLLYFYVRVWALTVTDLMQGPVYGMFTDETEADERLHTVFSYDDVFGTVLNRFIVQAVAGFPLTVYGEGGQTRGYLNIRDTMQCLALALENPPKKGEMRILNQFTETFTVNDLAAKVQATAAGQGLEVTVRKIPNPRVEQEEHYYKPAHSGLADLGLKPHMLSEGVLAQMIEFVERHDNGIRRDTIEPTAQWR